MGVIGRIFGGVGAVATLAEAAGEVAGAFGATNGRDTAGAAQQGARDQFGAEFAAAGTSVFDRGVNGLNRLPRPLLALGTIGLFGYAMVDPQGFTRRMDGLHHVPEPLWWLLTAIVGFYYGAREAHYFRAGRRDPAPAPSRAKPAPNPALTEWRRRNDR